MYIKTNRFRDPTTGKRGYIDYFHIPPNYVVERVRRSSKASRREDLQVEHPVWCGYSPAFHFHATLAGMLSPTLIGDQVVEVRESGEKRLLTVVSQFFFEAN